MYFEVHSTEDTVNRGKMLASLQCVSFLRNHNFDVWVLHPGL